MKGHDEIRRDAMDFPEILRRKILEWLDGQEASQSIELTLALMLSTEPPDVEVRCEGKLLFAGKSSFYVFDNAVGFEVHFDAKFEFSGPVSVSATTGGKTYLVRSLLPVRAASGESCHVQQELLRLR